ncbi:linear amide C-N hydrolase [Desulfobaculum bizertense]|uniref:Choloylglycine hydrolase n=1 Tax=Desulfobaculum bizertense DSM 18034 TaxID=1121442 RepID=A0A1T4VU88_9BACT|nr:linear amide C-N hydrolase [Desulfobaculum bizertense]SKA68507.1 choloylglycine hydrolase [Desulfobaculum bizertense DSM 18034]
MRKTLIISTIILAYIALTFSTSPNTMACSEIHIQNNNANVSARNFDFMSGKGLISISPRGQLHKSAFSSNAHPSKQWTSKYASVSFWVSLPSNNSNPILAGVDGINEAGLKIGTYFLEASQYPAPTGSESIAITSYMQYLLDNYANVAEALADIQSSSYTLLPVSANDLKIKLHFYIHDQDGHSAIIDFLDGQPIIFTAPKTTILTNTPYSEALKALTTYSEFGGKEDIPGGPESLERFVRGAFYKKHLPAPATNKQAINSGFALVQLLSVPPKFEHGCTQWTIVTDIKNKRIFYRTLNDPTIQKIDLTTLDFSKAESKEFNQP